VSALERRLDVAVKLARQAGELALRMRPAPGAATATLKGVQDWLTEADGAVEAFLAKGLAEAFPEDGFQGEEGGLGRSGSLRWVVDPIDGTSNYARGADRWCVSVGLMDDREALLGVLEAPALHETFAARKGGGATLNGAPARAAATTRLTRAMVECGWSHRRSNDAYYTLIAAVMGQGCMMRAGGSGAMALADVACGRLDAYVELHINLWDVAAGLAILAEAGAVTSPFLEGDGAGSGNPIIAAAPGIAAALGLVTEPLLFA
jgi:myo-inositol-1(or 4)-monophosphatase